MSMRLGIAHHFGWAVAVTASADHEVVDRRRIELIEPGMPTAPIHHEGKPLDDAAAAALVARGASVGGSGDVGIAGRARKRAARTDRLDVARAPGRSTSPTTSPSNVACPTRPAPTPSCTARCWPNSHAHAAGTSTSTTPRTWRPERPSMLGERADEVLHGPRATLGPPWAKDHRMALAATIVAS